MDPLATLKKKIEGYKDQLSQHLMTGGVRTQEEYRHVVGKAEAFEYILSDIADIEKQYMDE